MKIFYRTIFVIIIFFLIPGCEKTGKSSDRLSNGGMLRYTIEDKSTHDVYVVAQFTPRGDLFDEDNLQIYNYNLDSEKYPRLLISIDHKESNLEYWKDISFSPPLFSLTPSAGVSPLPVRGTITITQVSDDQITGKFDGILVSEKTQKRLKIRGEFKAVLTLNI
ncbi:hypothetical protein GF407_16805 [candidate division KSB1 bacterium]|nr:hypothetical protein [candidate division KSB1 bacterium]